MDDHCIEAERFLIEAGSNELWEYPRQRICGVCPRSRNSWCLLHQHVLAYLLCRLLILILQNTAVSKIIYAQ